MPTSNLKIPPHDLEAETSVLGALMLDKDAVIKIADIISPEDFYDPRHQNIYEAILDLFGKNKPIDLLTVTNRLKEKKVLKEIGGAGYLTEIIETVPTSAHIEHYAQIVREKRIRRDFMRASSEIHEKALNKDGFEELIDDVEKKIFSISQLSKPQKFIHIKDELGSAYERLEKLHRGDGALRGVPTGFTQLDNLLSGLQKSDLILLGARPSFGKTSLALDIARQAAFAGKAVGVFSLEMSREQIVDRLIASQAQVPLWRLRTGRLNDELEFQLVQNALDELSRIPLFIDDTPSPNILQMRSMARRLQIEQEVNLLIIDYLQLIQPRGTNESMVQQITEISRSLKSLARELDIPILALSQLSRAVDQRDIKIPRLSDLRESGCLTGDTLITLANGARIPIKTLAINKNHTPIKIFALNKDYKLKPFLLTNVFPSGKKMVFKLFTKSGRVIKASSNHPFLTLEGWKHLENLKLNEEIAMPRIIPTDTTTEPLCNEELILLAHLIGDGCILPNQPYHYTNSCLENIEYVKNSALSLFNIEGRVVPQKNWYHIYLPSPYRLTHRKKHPITKWFEKLSIERVRSYNKKISEKVFLCSNAKIAIFLKHLWSTDGNLSWKYLRGRRPAGNIYYATTSPILAEQVQHLLLRLSIHSVIKKVEKTNYKPTYHIHIMGACNQIKFLERIGIADRRKTIIPKLQKVLHGTVQNPNTDVIPKKIWKVLIEPAKEMARMSWREFSAGLETAYCGSTLFKCGVSRERMMRTYTSLQPRLNLAVNPDAFQVSQTIKNLAVSDIFWDTIKKIELLGIEDVYDATVPGAHNFIANDFIVHNSLEQDADVVLFLYRKDRDKIDVPEEEQNMVDVIIAKHRNGPLGTAKLRFDPERVTFKNIDTHHIEE